MMFKYGGSFSLCWMGCKDWFTTKVSTLGEFDAALAEAEKAKSGVSVVHEISHNGFGSSV